MAGRHISEFEMIHAETTGKFSCSVLKYGNYFAINDAYYYSGPLALWKQSPRERLAESVVNCKLGSPNHSGMALVPRAKFTPFLNEFKASLAAAR